jgi:peptide deformylase
MAILEIKKYNNPVLRKKCQEVKEISDDIRKLINDMQETMRENKGVGLAAPQVGILKRIVVIDLDFIKQDISELINPKILNKSREIEIEEEGCLSFPNVFLKIKRAKKIEVEYLDKEGKQTKIEASGLLARVIQHEIDHLDGILFFDRLPFLQRIKFKFKNIV